MKLFKHSYLLLFFVVLFSCDKQEDPTPTAQTLNHDSANYSSPNLPTGTWELGASFTSSETSDFVGKELKEIDFYLYNKPDSAWVAVYASGSTSPGSLLYSAAVTNDLVANGWNTHTLTSDIAVTDGIWITFGYVTGSTKQVIGCDQGPAVSGGDRIKQNSSSWTTFQSLYNGSINWNIRATVKIQK